MYCLYLGGAISYPKWWDFLPFSSALTPTTNHSVQEMSPTENFHYHKGTMYNWRKTDAVFVG